VSLNDDKMPTPCNEKSKPNWSLLVELAYRAHCDPRSLQKVLQGGTVRGSAGLRAAAALRKAGLL
jgi:hypothetical protein